jgi:Spy/CpxP family protein refolding chaperone
MSRTWTLAGATALMLLPAGLLAQNPPMRQGGMMRRDPVSMVLDQKDQLKLSDDQVKQITAIQQDLQKKNAPIQEKMQAARQKYGNPPSDADRAKMREEMGPMFQEMRSNNDAAMASVMKLLNADQQKTVQDMMSRRPGGRGPGGPGAGF